jgi:hypothetical protein
VLVSWIELLLVVAVTRDPAAELMAEARLAARLLAL